MNKGSVLRVRSYPAHYEMYNMVLPLRNGLCSGRVQIRSIVCGYVCHCKIGYVCNQTCSIDLAERLVKNF